MPDLRELYQEVILEHSKAPRNYRELATANHKAEGYNPLCGDHFTVYLDLEGDSICDISFQGSGCAISKASASMMTQSVKGKTRAEAETLRAVPQAGDWPRRRTGAGLNWVSWPFSPASLSFLCGSSAQPLPGTHCTLQCKERGNRVDGVARDA